MKSTASEPGLKRFPPNGNLVIVQQKKKEKKKKEWRGEKAKCLLNILELLVI